jgi:hypothetical protein
MELTDDTIDIFKNDAIYYIQIDEMINNAKNEIKPIQEKIKKLLVEKKELEKQLCKTMSTEKNNLKRAEFSESLKILEYKTRKTIVPVKISDVKDKLTLFFEDGPGSRLSFNGLKSEEKGDEIYRYIYSKENRETIVKESIKSKDMNQ